MAVITISRELAALGDETARELSKQLGYRIVERSSVERSSMEDKNKPFGIDDKFEKYDEKKPSILASLSRDREDYIHFLKTAVFAEACKGNCIFIGRGAGVILKGIPGVIQVFLTAPVEIRLERIKSYFHCDKKRAQHIIDQADNDRGGFHRDFFDVDWKDMANYHLVLNTGCIHPSVCAALVKSMCESVISGEDEKQYLLRVNELKLGHEIKHHILYEKEVSVHFFEAVVNEKRISLLGAVNSQAQAEAAVQAAKEIAPDGNIQSEIQIVQEYSVMP